VVSKGSRMTPAAQPSPSLRSDRGADEASAPTQDRIQHMQFLRTLGWLACVIYSTVPLFWLMVHPRAHRWRQSDRSPFRFLVPAWLTMWVGIAAITEHWRSVVLYSRVWSWIPAVVLFVVGLYLYIQSGAHFSWTQLGGLPEVRANHRQALMTTGIRARVRHPVYLAHLCEMLAWSLGTGLVVCWVLTTFALATGAVMIRMEDAELEKRFGKDFLFYRSRVPAIFPIIRLG
jgi:protein-S-isoprenylcysteine O-methyltransferase Ste14